MKKKTLLQSSGFVTLCASLVCIVIGLLVGFLVLLLLGGEKAYSDGFKQILLGGCYSEQSGVINLALEAFPLRSRSRPAFSTSARPVSIRSVRSAASCLRCCCTLRGGSA